MKKQRQNTLYSIILYVFLCSCAGGINGKLPEFGIDQSNLNSEIRLIPLQTSVKSSDDVTFLLLTKSNREVIIKCESSMEVFFINNGNWDKEFLPCQFLGNGGIIVSQDIENIGSIKGMDPINPLLGQPRIITPELIENSTLGSENPIPLESIQIVPSAKDTANYDEEMNSALAALLQYSDENPEPVSMEPKDETTIKPEDPLQETKTWIHITTRKVRNRPGNLVIFVRAEARDIETNVLNPIGAYASIWIVK